MYKITVDLSQKISRKSILYSAAASIKWYLNTRKESRNAVCIINEWENRYSLCTIRTCTFVQSPAVWNKEGESHPSLSWPVSSKQRYTFTLHRHRERIALNGTTTRMASSARARRLVHRLTDSHCSLVTWPRLTLKLIQSVALLPGGEIRETIQTNRARQTTENPVVGYEGRQNRREEKRQGERGLRGVAALVGTRLGVGSFVSWTLLLARINLLPPPLASPPPTDPLRRSLPRPSPPCSGKGGFRSPPVS